MIIDKSALKTDVVYPFKLILDELSSGGYANDDINYTGKYSEHYL